jgi:D-alanyl-lipoteichoic acid acyltransferase DltB (MBOAT superfamily)
MLFNSPFFIFAFLPIAAIVFYLIGNRGHFRIATSWLVLASLFFYGYWNPAYLWVIVGSILVNYSLGVLLSTSATKDQLKNIVLAIGVTANILLLGYYKYANFFIDTINRTGLSDIQIESIVLPLAISFFTFQQIAYLVDAWKGEVKEYNFLDYCLFVTFFPQLIAGPIVHHKEMLPQFKEGKTYKLNHFNITIGISIFLVGLFKKVVIADNLSVLASPVFSAAENGEVLHFFEVAEGIIAYTFQLYFDFSGYSDMAVGIARLFGIRLPLNFNSPYKAENIIDFWRRWHITLSRFLRDYIYIPLGGNRKGRSRRHINLMATMLLGGLWHGAGWTFVFWGALHGFYLIVNHGWQKIWKRRINKWWSIAISRIVTLFLVMFAWIFFRAESFDGAMQILKGFTNLPHTPSENLGFIGDLLVFMGFQFNGPSISASDIKVILMFFALTTIVWFIPNTQQLFAKYRPAYGYYWRTDKPVLLQSLNRKFYWRPNVAWSVWIAILGASSLLSLSRVSEFLYFQF